MHIFSKAHCAVIATALAMTLTAAAPASAFSASGFRAASPAPATIVKIHDRWNDDDENYAVGRYGRHIVAPFVDIWVPR
jgi:hypothetical protein